MYLEQDGPTVVGITKGCGPGAVSDAFFRFVFVIDMGAPGYETLFKSLATELCPGR